MNEKDAFNDLVRVMQACRFLMDTMYDLAKNGTRHDLNPTLRWMTTEELNQNYTVYLQGMDKHVRDKAAAAHEEAVKLLAGLLDSQPDAAKLLGSN